MVMTPSTMLDLGSQAPDFRLRDANGDFVSLDGTSDALGYLVMFICNHCPFVKHIRAELAKAGNTFQDQGISVFAISSNDVEAFPEDGPRQMSAEAREAGYRFPYLFDESQEAAKAYRAACTPDFFLFDRERRLVYRGQFDDSRPGNDIPVTGSDLRQAVEALLSGREIVGGQKPSVGCNIKWRKGNEPDYFSA